MYDNPNLLQGPWPECEGWSGADCKDYIDGWIRQLAPDDDRETVVRQIPAIIDEYQQNRVWIQCDHLGRVLQMPQRG